MPPWGGEGPGSVSARLASSTPHTHRPRERGVGGGTHIYHWGTAVGLPGTGHSSLLHAHAHPHTRTHFKNTTLVLRTLCVLCKSWACDKIWCGTLYIHLVSRPATPPRMTYGLTQRLGELVGGYWFLLFFGKWITCEHRLSHSLQCDNVIIRVRRTTWRRGLHLFNYFIDSAGFLLVFLEPNNVAHVLSDEFDWN